MKSRLYIILGLSLIFSRAAAQPYDLLLKGGHLIDPAHGIDRVMDIAVVKDSVVRVAAQIPASEAKKTIDLKGKYIAPGLIDMHVHVFHGNHPDAYIADGYTSVPPDGFTFRNGVTTVVDAGSSGWRNFPQFKKQTIDRSKTRVLALLNIVGYGMTSRFDEQNTDDMNAQQAAHMITRLYPDIIVGIKSAHYWGGFEQVDRAVAAGRLANVPVMVDFGEHQPPNSIESLFFDHLRPGDIFTHTFSYGPNNRETIVDENQKLKPFVLRAQQRGILFDVGHGGGAFSFRQAVPAARQGFWPDFISTDLHTESMNAGMKDLTNVMSKFLSMGMPLKDVIARVTSKPAAVIRRPALGHLGVGAVADIAVFEVEEGRFGYLDVRGMRMDGKQRIRHLLTVRAGKVVWDLEGLAAADWNSEIK
ncbi:MAG: amidohydrolase/deacetylase family metallohydrolase [Chitinophagaceae bacterium]|jgi:dihydroorotase